MSDSIDLFEAMYTQRAVRQFQPDPVPDELLHRLIEAATKAPSGANRQLWRFLVIKDTDLKRRISEYYQKSWDSAYGDQQDPPAGISRRAWEGAHYLGAHMHETPVLILACIEHDGTQGTTSRGSSIYPAVQNLLLAARGLGLGSVMTTLHGEYEAEIRALLGIPDNVETAALLPIEYPAEGVSYGPTRRQPVDQVTYWDRWGAAR